MTFEERKKQVDKHRRLANSNQVHIDEHPFVIAKKKLIAKHTDAIKKLLEECTHDDVVKHSQYVSGSYYDKAYTEYWVVCTLCGAKSERTTETHSWYG